MTPGAEPVPVHSPQLVIPAAEYFRLLSDSILELHRLLRLIQQRMPQLSREYVVSFPRSRLRLNPWRRRKHDPPYTIYWIKLYKLPSSELPPNAPDSLALPTIKRPRWKRYIRRLTNSVIHFAGGELDARRQIIHDFDRRRLALNQASSALRRTIDACRRSLLLRYPSGDVGGKNEDILLRSPAFSGDLPLALAPVLLCANRLAHSIEHSERDLRALAARHNDKPPCPYLTLIFVRDGSHPYGRIVWYAPLKPASYSKLTDKDKRRLFIPARQRKELTPFERERKRLTRIHQRHTSVLSRIKKRAAEAVAVAGRRLEEAARKLSISDLRGPELPRSRSHFSPRPSKENPDA